MVRYKMVGRDVNSSPTQYRQWIVNDTPDLDGYYYTGLKSGPEPFVDISTYKIPDGYVMDFNLPLPLEWDLTFRALPEAVSNSQLAILDGYVYLFGGEVTDVIYRASLDSPADWIDTGATLPTILSGAQFVDPDDGYIYLIGGLADLAVDTIYRAPRSNPLDWTNMGSCLPRELHKSQLLLADGYLYLFGGHDLNEATNVIFQASISDPLTWTDTGQTLPDKLYGSTLGVMDGYVVLLGGLFKEDSPTKNIYRALLTAPTLWGIGGYLPYEICYSQFATIGSKGYLFTQGAFTGTQDYLTTILRCNISAPFNWIDTLHNVPGDITQSQLAVIYDRLFLFGGNGISIIVTCKQNLKYHPAYQPAVDYGDLARTQFQAASTLDRFIVLGFPPWKTDYS